MKPKKIMLLLLGLSIALINSLQVLAQGPGQYVTGQEGPSGGPGGSFRDTYTKYPAFRLTSITINSGTYIDALTLSYDGGKAEPSPVHCGGPGGSPKILTLSQGEYIVRVTGKYNQFVEYLYIQTAGGSGPQYMEFGNKQSTARGYFDYQAPAGLKIGNFILKSGQYIDAIGVVLQNQ